MGALHAGHGALIQRAAPQGPVLVSVFVNPLQFGPSEDFDHYPRTLDADCLMAEEWGAAALWAPSVATVYPQDRQVPTHVAPVALQQHLCGAGRPGHFDGVVTVVARLLDLVRPQQIWLGEKDWQQLVILRRLVQDLDLPVRVCAVATSRETDGLARSSRNKYLSPSQRLQASALPFILGRAAADSPLAAIRSDLTEAGLEVEYLERVDPLTLQPCGAEKAISLLAAAVRCGTTRLIDHVFLMTRQPLVAIDGPAGAGKSTVTRAFAERLGLIYLDTGAMYRSVTWWVLKNGVDPADAAAIEPLLGQFELQLQSNPGAGQLVLVNGVDVSEAIRSPEVTASVSAVAAHRCVRQALPTQQKAMGAKGGLVADCR